MTDQMKWANALSTRPSLEAAIEEVVEQAQQRLQSSADLGLVFISSAFASEFSRLLPLLRERLSISALIGCSGGGVVGMDATGRAQEVEGGAAISLTLAHLPGVNVQTFHVSADDLPDLDSSPDRWIDLMQINPQDQPQFVLLADPSSGINNLLQGLDFAYPEAVKVGGLADIGTVPNRSGLFCDDRVYQEGAVGVALSGNVVVEAIVAQGCRPIGQPYRVVEGERNILMRLEEQADGDTIACGVSRTPLEVLQTMFQDLAEADRELAQHSLFVGIARNEFKQRLERGDFLIRNLLGVDPKSGAIAVGDRVRLGQRIQFHLRDAETSGEDLEMLLDRYQQHTAGTAAGALMFSCMGRGAGLYGQPNYDANLFDRYIRNTSLSGFFCNGEIGPVGDTTFLHGYTSVFAICRQP